MPEIPGYAIAGELGRGGMGVVYKARQLSLNRTVALKMVLSPDAVSGNQLARFRREAETVARLSHPGVVQVFDFGEADGRPFYSMELVDGGTLRAKLDTRHPTAREVAATVAQLAEAVQHIHDQNVIHRDLKPSNVLLTRGGSPKVSDFGLAKPLDDRDPMTASGVLMGTLHYMAPEQAAGRPELVGPSADVYALGVILYEMLVGRTPFHAPDLFTLLDLIRTGIPTPPRRLRPAVPPALEAVCLRCLRKDPTDRVGSARTLASELRQFLGEGTPPEKPPVQPTRPEPNRPASNRDQWWRQ